jgi:hypothetical protein
VALEQIDDMINFRDSDRESVVSYFVKNGISYENQIDTPTRILNRSNDFLPITYSDRLEKAIEEMDRMKEEEVIEKRHKRTKSMQVVTIEAEMK